MSKTNGQRLSKSTEELRATSRETREEIQHTGAGLLVLDKLQNDFRDLTDFDDWFSVSQLPSVGRPVLDNFTKGQPVAAPAEEEARRCTFSVSLFATIRRRGRGDELRQELKAYRETADALRRMSRFLARAADVADHEAAQRAQSHRVFRQAERRAG
jgi:hypothetical protein